MLLHPTNPPDPFPLAVPWSPEGQEAQALHSAAVAAFNAIRKVEADHREAIETAEQLKAEREMALRRAAEGKAASPEAEKLSNVGEWMADLFR